MNLAYERNALCRPIRTRQLPNAFWGEHTGQGIIETTSLALLALRQEADFDVVRVTTALHGVRNRDGGWPAFTGDDEGCWVTSLVINSLLTIGKTDIPIRSIDWLLDAAGREGMWFWRWKFRYIDKGVKFDPAKYGWSWGPGTTSWAIPTSFSLMALQRLKNAGLAQGARVGARVALGINMLLDRMCPGGGWNAGNGAVFGVPLAPYIDATAIALLALQSHECEAVDASLRWLRGRLRYCPSPYSLAWGILALAAYERKGFDSRDSLNQALSRLTTTIAKPGHFRDTATLAISTLALSAVDGDNVFAVQA
jgi:hypothetical protein